jgi:peptide-methionine (S)-S-oxide reductase
VIRTRVGYTGGAKLNPTYASLGNHTESLQIDFDPRVVSYEQLLGVFWASHDPSQRPYSQQYKAAVFYANEQQRTLAERTARDVEHRLGQPVYTEILPLGTFYRAEDYHQKYYLRHAPRLWSEIAAVYGADERGLEDSTLAARLNGYAAGVGDAAQLDKELDSYGLSDAGRRRLEGLAPGLRAQAPGLCGASGH